MAPLLGSEAAGLGSVLTAAGGESSSSSSGDPGVVGKFTGTIFPSDAGATFSYMADPGQAGPTITANETSGQLYPTSARTIQTLRAVAKAGTGGSAYTLTLYKNGAATAMTVTFPNTTAPGTELSDSAHPVTFSPGDTFDVRIDVGITDDGATPFTAVLEGPTGSGGGGGGGDFPGFGAAPPAVAAAASPGVLDLASRSDHTHQGASSVNGQIGAVTVPFFTNGIATGAVQLGSLASASFTAGAIAWVATVRAEFVLQQSSLAVDNISVVAATGKAGFQWVRKATPNRYWWSSATFPVAIDPSAGSDENTGLAGNALKTCAEWYRRTIRAQLSGFNPVVNILNDVPDGDDLVVDVDSFDGSANITIQGQTTVASTQTVASAQARNSAANQANQITVTGFDFTPYLGSLVRVQGTSNYAVITKLLTTTTANDTARLGELWNTSTFAQASSTGIGAGATIEITSQTKGPLRYTVLGKQPPTLQDLRFDGTGGVILNTTRCVTTWVARRLVIGGSSGSTLKGYDLGGGFTSVAFRQPVSATSAQLVNYLGCAFLGTSGTGINAHNALKTLFNGCVAQASAIQVASGNVRVTLDFGTFDLGAAKIGIELPFDSIGGNLKFVSGRHYGSGNNATSNFWSVTPPGMIVYSNALPPTCDAGNGASINGVNTPIGSLPVPFNTSTGCGVIAL